MNTKITIVAISAIVIIFILSILFNSNLTLEDEDLAGEAYRRVKVSQYVETFNLDELPKKISYSEYYQKNQDFPGNLGPFPSKSLQPNFVLNKYGIKDSEMVNLVEFYLQEGPQTKITSLIKNNAALIESGQTTEETVINIINWIHDMSKCSKEEASQYKKRERTAHNIILSECATGCTDYTLVFATLARAKGIPATVTETIGEKWVAEMVWNNEWDSEKRGHFFSEVYLKDKWVLVDPTAKKFTGKDSKGYYPSGPGNNKKFLFFERGLDSWDYGIKTDAEFGNVVKKRYYIEGTQP